MKNFILGILVTLVGGLLFQNINLRQELMIAQSQSAPKNIAKTVNKSYPKVTKVKKAVAPTVVALEDGRDPSCPPHLPYRAGHWGCVVKRNP